MDPSATLFTFMLETHPSVQTVTLVGSWDNFTQHYTMERDARRDKGQWRGCHALRTLPGQPGLAAGHRRGGGGGGLRMGQTYHYYYEVNCTTETHDPSQPTTTTCPSLPGQVLNTLDVPIEHSLLHKSSSMNNLRYTDFKTLDPKHRYVPLMPPQPHPLAAGPTDARIGSSPAIQLMRKRSARSLSPGPKWTASARKIFGTIRPSSRESNGSARNLADFDGDVVTSDQSTVSERARSTTPSSSIRSRDISPDSLRRFLLADDAPPAVPMKDARMSAWNADDAMEDIDDDDNFAVLATSPPSETPFTTLSPPPPVRSISAQSASRSIDESMTTGLSAPPVPRSVPAGYITSVDGQAKRMAIHVPRSRFAARVDSQSATSPVSQTSAESREDANHTSFFDDSDDDCDSRRSSGQTHPTPDLSTVAQTRDMPGFTGYSLPRHVINSKDQLVLTLPQLEAGLGDLAEDMGWITSLLPSKTA